MQTKEIRRFFLGITTHCNMACPYCFVKDTNKFMSVSKAEEYIKFFLESAGKNKLLYFYGGEPLIYFDFIKKVIPFLNRQAKKLNKVPSVIFVTNGTIFNKEIGNFIKKYQIKMMISISGKEKSHNLFRKFRNGQGTFNVIKKNLPKFFKVVNEKNLWASYTLHPLMLKNFYQDFFYLVDDLGFKNIHIEPVQYVSGVSWNSSQLLKFKRVINSIFSFMKKNIDKNKFYFNSKVIRNLEILLKVAPQEDFLHSIYNNLRVWPRSELAFSHFAPNLNKKYPNWQSLFEEGFLNFAKQPQEKELKGILQSSIEINKSGPAYFKSGEKIWSVYNNMCKDLSKELIRHSKKNKFIKKYIQESLRRAI